MAAVAVIKCRGVTEDNDTARQLEDRHVFNVQRGKGSCDDDVRQGDDNPSRMSW